MVKHAMTKALLLVFIPTQLLWAQQPPDVRVGVRPDRVRAGESVVVTVRVTHTTWPDQVDLRVGPGGAVQSYEDRPSSGAAVVFERDFHVLTEAQGRLAMTAVVVFGADTLTRAVPEVAVHPPGLAWPVDPRQRGSREADGTEPLPEGTPPSSVGRDADRERAPQGLYPPGSVLPGGGGATGYPYRYPDPYGYPDARGQTVPTPGPYGVPGGVPPGGAYGGAYGNPYASPYGPSGWGVAPYGSGWAPGAAGDPWWPELVPRLERYATVVDDPSGIVRLEAGMTPERVYVGQQATFLATATFPPEATARLGGPPEFFPPTATDAWTVDLPYAPPTAAAARGRAQEAHTFMRAFFPRSAGRFTVDPARLLYSVGSGVPGRPMLDTLATEALQVEVLPVPERDAPPGWNGAVGRYRVAAWLEPETVAWGEAAFLTVAVSGAGHVRSLTRPDPGQVWGAELRPTGERALPEVRDGVVGGVKTFSWLVVPMEPGPLRIGPVIFSYFDPWTGAFAQVATEELILRAGDLPSGVQRGGGGPRTPGAIREAPATSAVPAPGSEPSPVTSFDGDTLPGLATAGAGGPTDGDAWHTLARGADAALPGEGWAMWASLAGLRADPRHGELRALVRGGPQGGGALPGVSRVPLGLGESLTLGVLFGTTGLLLLVAALRGMTSGGLGAADRSPPRGLLAGLPLVLLAAVCLEPAVTLQQDAGVVVGGAVGLRVHPTMNAAVVSGVSGGTPLRVEERFGGWLRVTTPGGTGGWVEDARVATLPPVTLF